MPEISYVPDPKGNHVDTYTPPLPQDFQFIPPPVITSDATVTTLYQFTPADNCVVQVVVYIFGATSDAPTINPAASYRRAAAFRVNAGAVTILGGASALNSTFEEAANAAWDATLDATATQIRVRVTGWASAQKVIWTAKGKIVYWF